ncbi:predicted protein [Chaetomium globosum CBS 148.51]|uniref:Uncharacterized protein n=1 Tax=Chaetomium globosum (strain ATCC 6205 / CBS 148.51 / DSM 1962 / NBRC 6347 / NRRL 1970) TaxID=306901 RepID=Q2GVD7_CHAGB|nr:uncharacterized protein CHGG_08067 [Chaetomium globosum CBS 148.51]EAQ86814.1 predicted protein [Chaetomium globosum CBS 148.51]
MIEVGVQRYHGAEVDYRGPRRGSRCAPAGRSRLHDICAALGRKDSWMDVRAMLAFLDLTQSPRVWDAENACRPLVDDNTPALQQP